MRVNIFSAEICVHLLIPNKKIDANSSTNSMNQYIESVNVLLFHHHNHWSMELRLFMLKRPSVSFEEYKFGFIKYS